MNADKPEISVILPTYNHVAFLPRAVASIFNQDFDGRYELVIVDDASTDDTRNYLSTLRLGNCTVVRHESNRRLPTALNTGLAHAHGEFVTWISSDNIPLPNYLSALHRALKARPECGFAYSAFETINESDEHIAIFKKQDFSYSNLLRGNPGCAAFMYQRSLHDLAGLYDPALEGAEDWDMWLRFLEHTRAVYTHKVTYKYRLHGDSMTGQMTGKTTRSSRKAVANAFARAGNYFDMAKVYPALAKCVNKKQAWHDAFADFAASILSSHLHDPKNAFLYLDKALDIEPNCLTTQFNKLVAYQHIGDLSSAHKQLDALQRAAPAERADLKIDFKPAIKALENGTPLCPIFLAKDKSELLSRQSVACV